MLGRVRVGALRTRPPTSVPLSTGHPVKPPQPPKPPTAAGAPHTAPPKHPEIPHKTVLSKPTPHHPRPEGAHGAGRGQGAQNAPRPSPANRPPRPAGVASGAPGGGRGSGSVGFRPRPRSDIAPIRFPASRPGQQQQEAARVSAANRQLPRPQQQRPTQPAAAAAATRELDVDPAALLDADLGDSLVEAKPAFKPVKKTFPKSQTPPRPPHKPSALAADTEVHSRRKSRQPPTDEEEATSAAVRRGLASVERLGGDIVVEEEEEAMDLDEIAARVREGAALEEEEVVEEVESLAATAVAPVQERRSSSRSMGPFKNVVELTPLGPDPEERLKKYTPEQLEAIRRQRDVTPIAGRMLRRLKAHQGDPAELIESYDAFADADGYDEGLLDFEETATDAALLADVESLLAKRGSTEAEDLSSDEARALVEFRIERGLSRARAAYRQKDGKYIVDIVDTVDISDEEVKAQMAAGEESEDEAEEPEDADLMLPEEAAVVDALEAADERLADEVDAEDEWATREKRNRIKGMMRRKLRDELDSSERQLTEEDIRLAHGRTLRHFSRLHRIKPEEPPPTSTNAAITREHARLYKDMGLQPRHVTRHRKDVAHNELVELGIIDEPMRPITLPALDEAAVEQLSSFYRKTDRGADDAGYVRLFETAFDMGPDKMAPLPGRSNESEGSQRSLGSSGNAPQSGLSNSISKRLEGMVPSVQDPSFVPPTLNSERPAPLSAEEQAAHDRLSMRAAAQAVIEDDASVPRKALVSVDAILAGPDVNSENDNYMFQFPASHQVDYSLDKLKELFPSMQQETLETLHDAHLVLSRNPFWSPKQKQWTLRVLAKASEQTLAGVAVNPDDPTDTDIPRNLLQTPKNLVARIPVDKWKRSMHDVYLQGRRAQLPRVEVEEPPKVAAPPPKPAAAPAKGAKKPAAGAKA